MSNKKKRGKDMSIVTNRFYNATIKTVFCFVTAFTIAMAPVVTPLVLAEDDGTDTGSGVPIVEVVADPGLVPEVTATEPATDDPAEESPVEEVAGEQVASEHAEASPSGNSGSGSSTEEIVGCNPDPDPNPEVPCGENMILNGDFEIPVVTSGWDIYDSYIDGLMWTVKWMPGSDEFGGQYRPRTAHLELQRNVNGWLPYSGNQYAELDTDWDGPTGSLGGEPASVKIYQDLITEPSKEYQATFYFSPRPNTTLEDNILQFSWGGSVIDTISEAGGSDVNWTMYTHTLTATGTKTRVEFSDLGTPNSLGTFLDNVVVYEICEEPPQICEPGPQWADNVEDADQGNTKGGGSVIPARSDPESALGEPDGVFFSLGQGGSLTVSFDKYILDVEGDDLSFHEVTYGRYSYPEETIMVEVSQDGLTWFEVGNASNHAPADGVGYVDFSSTGLSWIQYVRITDTTDFDLHVDGADGYDIDAIDATYGSCNYGTLSKTGIYDYETGHITYTIIGSLYGEGMAYDIVITDELPEGTEFVSANYSGTETAGTVTWNMGDIMAPAMGVFKLEVVVSPLVGTDPWADAVISFNQGLNQDGSPVLLERSDPTQALGEAERTDVVNFVSLGFGGEIILEFDEPIFNGTGDDIEIVETSYGDPSESAYPETAEVYASQNGTDWTFLANAILDEMVDLGPLPWAKYIKLVDISNPANFSGSADGFDIDGVRGLYPVPNICEIENTVYGEYQTEDNGGGETIWDSATTMTLINPLVCEPEEQEVTIVAHKIVCDIESELPDWGNGGPNITSITAEDWVANHRSCHFQEGWDFQWGPQGAYDPGDTLTGPANAPWQTMPPTNGDGMTTIVLTAEDIDGSSYLWFREVLEEGYIPFTHDQNGGTNSDPVSAEMYCHIDVLNYDNYDRIDGVELGQTYNCVGFNVPSEAPAYTVSGMKFNDRDGNGAKDEGESGLAKWTIYASKLVQTIQVEAQNDIPTSPEFWTNELTNGKEYILRTSGVYDANDYITADAKYSMRSVNGPDWTDIVKNYESYGPTLLDLFVDDVAPNWGVYNPAHVYWQTITGSGAEVKLQIYEIYAQNDSGALTVDVYEVIDTQITDEDGNYHFTFPEDIGEVVISEQTQDGWLQTLPSPEGYYLVDTDENYTDKDFGNHDITLPEAKLGSIAGMKFNDHNGDGVKNENDGPLVNWTIYLDMNDDGDLDFGEPTMMTLGDGSYAFTDLSSELYVVREIGQNGWTQKLPNAAADYAYRLTVTDAGDNFTGKDFGNQEDGGVTGQGGGGGGGFYYPTNETAPPDDGVVLGDQTDNGDVGGDGDVLGELVSAGADAWTALLVAILFGLLMTGLTYRYPELAVKSQKK